MPSLATDAIASSPSDEGYKFRLFAYLALGILSVAVIMGMYIILQQREEFQLNIETIKNQETIIQNQDALNQILSNTRGEIDRMEKMVSNRTLQLIENNKDNYINLQENTKKLDEVITLLKSQ